LRAAFHASCACGRGGLWAQALVGMLRVMVRCCKHSGVRKRSLITYKAPIILRKIVALPNDQLEFYGLQLYKVSREDRS
jgi:hypothetical protein